MGTDQPLFLLALLAAAAVVMRWWLADYRAAQSGPAPDGGMPGAAPAPPRAIGIAVVGVLVLLAAETLGENALGISAQQSRMTVLFGIYTLAAAFLEEILFRGYVVVTGRGRAALVSGIIAASAVFALLHPFLWEWRDGALEWRLDRKAWFSTAAIFAGSLWFYFVRFMPTNPRHSLLPCFAAHAAKNLGVFLIKAAQGYVVGWW